ncbi:MAG: MFS transporter [Chloroflexi bacterium]|nr:MFS transporter [Chloroflexota bacterium]MYF22926.1 MFS transporter [Chloroflexota bacterium]
MSDLAAEKRAVRGVPLPVVAVALAVAATLLGDSMLYAVMPSQPEAWALSLPAVGILLSANRLVRLVTNSVVAVIFQRLGQRGPFIAALLLSVVVTLCYGWSTAFGLLLAARMVWGFCWSTLRLGGFWTVLSEAGDHNRGLLMGAYSAIVRMGSVGGVLVGAALTDLFGHRLTLTLFAAVMAGTAVAWVLTSRRPALAARPAQRESERTDLRVVLTDRRLLVTCGAILVTGLVFSGLVTASLGFYLKEHFGQQIAILGMALGVTTATGILLGSQWLPLSPLFGYLSDRFGRVIVISAGFATGAAWLVVLAITDSIWLILAAVLSAFIASTSLTVTLHATAGDLAPPERRNAVLSAYATFLDLGSALGPLIGLSFASLAALQGLYSGAAVLLVVAALSFWLVFRGGPSQVAHSDPNETQPTETW